jgi:ATP-dependent helicase/nuclease subunit B
VAPLEANPLYPRRPGLQTAVLTCLDRGGIVLTGNARAARSLRQTHAKAQSAKGRRAWPTPRIYDWQSWLSILWNQYLQNAHDAPLLLTNLQERSVWKKIASPAASGSEATARLAAKAWELLSEFEAHSERNRSWSPLTPSDAEIFRGWASTFDRECRTNRWISSSDLNALLTEPIRKAALDLPAEILLVGFDRFTPAKQAVIDAVRGAGVAVAEPGIHPPPSQVTLVQAKEVQDELEACAWWARRELEKNPGASIAVIVQAADGLRGEIDRIFRRILMPESVGIEADDAMPFEFSLGTPLAVAPPVKAALLMLRWLVEPLEQAAISWLTMSGFLAVEGEPIEVMAEFDAEVRKRARMPPEVRLDAFVQYRPRLNSPAVAQFLSRLRDVQRSTEGLGSRRMSFPEAIDLADSLLKRSRWPGSRTLGSVEHQALARWDRLIGELASLGFNGDRVKWIEFVTVLDRYAGEVIFAPESRGAPIQIMGTLESAGQEFDALWFLGADEGQWPATGQANPLLPLWLQRKAAMPHSTPDEDWALSLALTRRLAASAQESVFSHALRNDEGELRPSALLSDSFGQSLTTALSEELRMGLRVLVKLPHRRLTEEIRDTSSVPWPIEIHAGGADVLKRQSACAFQSFAVSRLGAEELKSAERGLTAQERGNIAHFVLQAIWSTENASGLTLQSREDLINAKANGRLSEILREHIATVFGREFRGKYKGSEWAQVYLEIEQTRLHAVLSQWLDYEMKRVPFSVEESEKGFPVQIEGLRLNLRVDRIDRVAGGRLILDYKTGKVSPSWWNGERPDEPQLPLYGVYGPVEDVCGILFAKVRAGEMSLVGRARDAATNLFGNLSPGSDLIQKPLTDEMLGEWADALSNLADQFVAGNAAVEPKEYPKTCRYCALPALCRVSAGSLEHEVERPDTDEGGFADLEDGEDNA